MARKFREYEIRHMETTSPTIRLVICIILVIDLIPLTGFAGTNHSEGFLHKSKLSVNTVIASSSLFSKDYRSDDASLVDKEGKWESSKDYKNSAIAKTAFGIGLLGTVIVWVLAAGPLYLNEHYDPLGNTTEAEKTKGEIKLLPLD